MFRNLAINAFLLIALSMPVWLMPSPAKDHQIEDLFNYLKNADLENLDKNLMDISVTLKKEKRDASHFCCAVPNRNETYETRTRVVSFNTIASTQHIIGYEQCGNSSSTIKPPTTTPGQLILPTFPTCISKPIYETVTYMAIQYKTETYNVPVISVGCPEEHVICCEDYTMFNGQCILTSLLGNLQDLINLGIIGK